MPERTCERLKCSPRLSAVIAMVVGVLSLPAGVVAQPTLPELFSEPEETGDILAEPVTKDALWYLENEPQPVFREGHGLLPLSRWGWTMSFDVKVALADRFGYALMFPTPVKVSKLRNPASEESRLLEMAASDPERYPLAVTVPVGIRGQEKPEETWVHDAEGNRFDAPQWKTWSPEAPDAVYQQAADEIVEALKLLKERAPVSILLNGGEYGMSVLGHSQAYWAKDPKVLKAKGDQDWFDYISRRKAEHEMIITSAVRELFPDRDLYLWYHFGQMPGLLSWRWTYDYKYMREVADMPGQSLYYKHYNSGWTGNNDLLTNFLASVAMATEYGDPHSYNWLCAGWEDLGKFSDRDRYMGYIKCLYTAGQVGAVAGYFSRPEGGFNAELGDQMPSWLWQMVDLGRAHALFSHVDELILDGDLLPGDGKHRKRDSLPACEFDTGDPNARVLARKHRDRDEWLITAWAAAGEARTVGVTIPGLGDIDVLARPSGSVYRATTRDAIPYEPPVPHLELLDEDGMLPSAGYAQQEQKESADVDPS